MCWDCTRPVRAVSIDADDSTHGICERARRESNDPHWQYSVGTIDYKTAYDQASWSGRLSVGVETKAGWTVYGGGRTWVW